MTWIAVEKNKTFIGRVSRVWYAECRYRTVFLLSITSHSVCHKQITITFYNCKHCKEYLCTRSCKKSTETYKLYMKVMHRCSWYWNNVHAQAVQFIYQARPFFVLGFPFLAKRLAFTFFASLWFIQTGYRPWSSNIVFLLRLVSKSIFPPSSAEQQQIKLYIIK